METENDRKFVLDKLDSFIMKYDFIITSSLIDKNMRVCDIDNLLFSILKIRDIFGLLLIVKYIFSRKYKNPDFCENVDDFIKTYKIEESDNTEGEVDTRVVPRKMIIERIGTYISATREILRKFRNEIRDLPTFEEKPSKIIAIFN